MVAEEIAHLQKLQEYDLKILALKNRIDALPLGVAQLQGEAKEKNNSKCRISPEKTGTWVTGKGGADNKVSTPVEWGQDK